ncbi:hypothetical protein [Polaromonas sp. A23]|uniref:hypothetical protein n=1 Tax=Polaromonas sp. A23 TaxID=1944133 RepID=UPI0009874FBE|nr:hypothetical protein [Polaromonas sp. A23]OOG44607.1 hypothetical protein B0B52_05650 [Polaromonas sp. A23]
MTFRILSKALFCLALGLVFAFPSNSQSGPYPIVARTVSGNVFPIAIYRNIPVDQLNKLLIDSFSEFNFSLRAAKKDADGVMEFEFSYPVDRDGTSGSVIFKFKVDGTVVNRKCMNCFLRMGRLQDEKEIGKLSWMAQYELSSRLYPDIDRSYLAIKNKSQAYLDRQHGFDYRNIWDGERNRFAYGNVYVGIKLPDLKREISRALTDSGFILLRDSNSVVDATDSTLTFSFPIDSGKPEGAVYAIQFANQFDVGGLCYPCEAMQMYDPHQTLPPLGLSAMSGRLTLASRFESGLDRAYDQIKASTERYLRPRTQFVRPPKLAPLGTPRPRIMPVPPT